MDGGGAQPVVPLGAAALGQLMPMHLLLDPDCRVLAMGPTLAKLLGPAGQGAALTALFALQTPRAATRANDLTIVPRLRLHLRSPPGTGFKGVAVPLQDVGQVLLNLSFGWGVREAVRDHRLSDTDFAPTDLAIELLYLAEARAAVMGELDKMNHRLRGAKLQAEEQALTDPLTGLRNRRAMERQLALLIAARIDFALIHVDLDYFKQVNDTLGHAAGDHVLRKVATILRSAVRANDVVARVGGDEFVVLMSGPRDPAPLERLGAHILDRMQAPILFEGQPCRVLASMGAVLSAHHPHLDAARLLAEADRALYASKEAGRGRLTVAGPEGALQPVKPAPSDGGAKGPAP